MRAKGQFWGSVITDDEVDALLQNHGEIDIPEHTPDGLEQAVCAMVQPGGASGFGASADHPDSATSPNFTVAEVDEARALGQRVVQLAARLSI